MTRTLGIERKLTTILAADAANYSGQMAKDEVGTVQALRQSRGYIDTIITSRGGRIANTAGDGLIAEFPSVVEAVAAAVAIQRKLNVTPDGLAFRIGLHLGDVILENGDLLGDGVNIAARLQEIAPEGGIFASQQVIDHARGRLAADFLQLPPQNLKNMPEEVSVYVVRADGVVAVDALEPASQPVTPPPAPAADFVEPSAETIALVEGVKAMKDYKRYRRFAIGMSVVLIVINLLTNPSNFWSLWAVATFGGITYLKRRKVPERLLAKHG